MAALYALCAALVFGAGDFLGGFASRRVPVLVVILVSQLAGLLGILVWLGAAHEHVPPAGDLLAAAGAGTTGLIGLVALYRGLSLGLMAIVAPVSALSPLIALAADVINGKAPGPSDLLGIALVLTGLVVLSLEPDGNTPFAAGIGLALIAAVGFGLYAVGIDAGSDESTIWAVSVARGTAATLAFVAVLAARAPVGRVRGALTLVLGVGLFDTLGNVFLATATTHGLISIVDALAAGYPVVTVTLAMLVLHERPGARRVLAGLTAIGGAVMVAVG
ncbi:MAG: DMT family transporter [Gaiellales bacterium]